MSQQWAQLRQLKWSESTVGAAATAQRSAKRSDCFGRFRFGNRAKAIKNTPKMNEERTMEEMRLLVTKQQARPFRVPLVAAPHRRPCKVIP